MLQLLCIMAPPPGKHYCIAKNVGRRKHGRSWSIDLKFSPSKILILQILWRAEFAKVLYSKQSEELNLLMFSPANVFCYTVSSL